MKMRRSFVLFLVLSMVLGACAKLPPGASPTPTPEAGLPTPVLVLTQAPDVEKEAQAYRTPEI